MEVRCDVIIDDVLNKVSFMAGQEVSFDREAFEPEQYTALFSYMNYYDCESCDFGENYEYGAGFYSLDKAVKSVAYVLQERCESVESEYLNDVEGFTLSDGDRNDMERHAKLLYFISRDTLSKDVKGWVDKQMELSNQAFEAIKQ